MSVQQTLKNQAAAIDGKLPETEQVVDLRGIIAPSSTPFKTPEQVALAAQIKENMPRQNQFEFVKTTPKLDAGLYPGASADNIRAENQTKWDQLKIGAAQFAIEAGVGALQYTSLLADVGLITDIIQGEEDEFSNTVSRALGDTKERWAEAAGTIYRREDAPKFDPGSWSFWASNAGSLGSVIAVMAPSMAAAAIATKAGAALLPTAAVKGGAIATGGTRLVRAMRAVRASQKLKRIGQAGVSSVSSRLMENTLMASETVEEFKASLEGQINPETGVEFTEMEIAKAAGDAGAEVWRKGGILLALDMFQYGRMFRGINYARMGAKDGAKRGIMRRALTATGGFVAKDMGTESFEEGYQFIINKEAQRSAKEGLGLEVAGGSLVDRMADYFVDDDFKTSVLMGAVGGGVFGGVATVREAIEQRKARKERARLRDIYNKNHLSIMGNAAAFENAEAHEIVTVALEKARSGDIDQLVADFNDLYSEPDESLTSQNIDPKEYRDKITKALQVVETVAEEYNRSMNLELPEVLKTPHAIARLDQKLGYDYLKSLNDAKEQLLGKDKLNFEAIEKKTADQMVQLKRKVSNKQTKDADELAKDIVKNSDVYNSVQHVMSTIKTPLDAEYNDIYKQITKVNDYIEKAKTFEQDLETETGQLKRIAEIKAAREKADLKTKTAADAAAKKDTARKKGTTQEDTTTEEEETEAENQLSADEFDATGELDISKLDEETKKYVEERNKVAEEKGTYNPGTPDGTKVFSTWSNKKGGHRRTWVRNEVVKDGKGREWRVEKPIKNHTGVRLLPVDKKEGGKTIWEVEKEYGAISHESKKQGYKNWTVNKFKLDLMKVRQKQDNRAEVVYQQVKAGIIETGGQEFSNWKPLAKEKMHFSLKDMEVKLSKGDKFAFDGHPELSTIGWFDIDYAAAAKPMTPGVAEDAELVLNTDHGKDAIIVTQNNKIISQVFPAGKDEQFKALLVLLSEKGGTVPVKITNKLASFDGNLGNIPGSRTSPRNFIGSDFLYKGKVFLGSRKPKDTSIHFYSEDGDTYEYHLSDKQYSAGIGVGNTFMLAVAPDGNPVIITLNESTLSEVVGESGKSLAEETLVKLETKADELTEDFKKRVRAYRDGITETGEPITKISSLTVSIEQVKKDMGFLANSEKESGSRPLIATELEKILEPVVRLVEQKRVTINKKDKSGKLVENVHYELTKNYFNVRFNLTGETLDDINIGVTVTNAIDQTDPNKEYPFVRETAKTREAAIAKLGSRFLVTSLDKMADTSTRKEYIKKILDEQWVTTDIYPGRPWVNTRLVLELDAESKKVVKDQVQAPHRTAPKSAAAIAKSKKSKKEDYKKRTVEEARTQAIANAKKAVDNIIDILDESGMQLKQAKAEKEGVEVYTLEQFAEDHIGDLLSVEELTNEFKNTFSVLRDAKPNAATNTVAKLAMKEVAENILLGAEDSYFVEDTTEPKEVADTKKSIAQALENNKSTKDKLGTNPFKKLEEALSGSPQPITPIPPVQVAAKAENLASQNIPDEMSKKKPNFTLVKKKEPKEKPASQSSVAAERGQRPAAPDKVTLDKLLQGVKSNVTNLDASLSKEAITKAKDLNKKGNLNIKCKPKS